LRRQTSEAVLPNTSLADNLAPLLQAETALDGAILALKNIRESVDGIAASVPVVGRPESDSGEFQRITEAARASLGEKKQLTWELRSLQKSTKEIEPLLAEIGRERN
jgi:hypothetical protein